MGKIAAMMRTLANGHDAVYDSRDPLPFLALHFFQVSKFLPFFRGELPLNQSEAARESTLLLPKRSSNGLVCVIEVLPNIFCLGLEDVTSTDHVILIACACGGTIERQRLKRPLHYLLCNATRELQPKVWMKFYIKLCIADPYPTGAHSQERDTLAQARPVLRKSCRAGRRLNNFQLSTILSRKRINFVLVLRLMDTPDLLQCPGLYLI